MVCNAVVIGMWLAAVAFAQYDSASVFVIVFVSLLLLPVLLPIFKAVWEIGGLFRHRPSRSMPEQRSDLIPEDGGKRVRKPRRRKTPEKQQVTPADAEKPNLSASSEEQPLSEG
jgi:hypothetical protein